MGDYILLLPLESLIYWAFYRFRVLSSRYYICYTCLDINLSTKLLKKYSIFSGGCCD